MRWLDAAELDLRVEDPLPCDGQRIANGQLRKG